MKYKKYNPINYGELNTFLNTQGLRKMFISKLDSEYGKGNWAKSVPYGYLFSAWVNFDKIVFDIAKELSDETHNYVSALKKLSNSKYDTLTDGLANMILGYRGF